jgi:hypothetical protein
MHRLSISKDFTTRLLAAFYQGFGRRASGGSFTAPACPNVGFAIANEAHLTFKDLETAYPVSSWYIDFAFNAKFAPKISVDNAGAKSYFAADRRNKLSAPILDIPWTATPDLKGI